MCNKLEVGSYMWLCDCLIVKNLSWSVRVRVLCHGKDGWGWCMYTLRMQNVR